MKGKLCYRVESGERIEKQSQFRYVKKMKGQNSEGARRKEHCNID